jgi:transposase-like protein
VKAFLNRPLEGDWPYLWIYLKVRRGGRIVSLAAIIAIGVNTDGRREVLGLEIGASEAEPIDGVSAQAHSQRLARREAGDLGCA